MTSIQYTSLKAIEGTAKNPVKSPEKNRSRCLNRRLLFGVFICVAGTLVAVLSLAILFCESIGSMDERSALKAVAEGNAQFSLELYQLLKEKEGNVFVSPLSLEVVLAMAYFGAKGVTATQIAKGIHLPQGRDDTQKGFLALLNNLESTKNYTLEIANKVFTKNDYTILEEFKAVASKSFLSEAQELDFNKNVEAAGIINAWVEERTKKKIQNLITPDMLNSLTRLVFVNAVYFKGNWASKFNVSQTTTEPFFLNANEKKDVQMMHIKRKFGYSALDDLDATMLELPYQGDELSMVVLLPNEVDGIAKLEEKLVGVNLHGLMDNLGRTEVVVSLPKFKLEETMKLNDILRKMGMKEMYEDSADFSGITSSAEGLKVSEVVQKSFIEVNEEGSEAAAATGMSVMLMCMPPRPQDFKADHPFIFLLRSNATNTILFMGKLMKP